MKRYWVVHVEASEVLVAGVWATSVSDILKTSVEVVVADVDVLGVLGTLEGALGALEEVVVVDVDVLGALGTLEGTLGALEDILGWVEMGAEEVRLLGVGGRAVGWVEVGAEEVGFLGVGGRAVGVCT